MMLVTPVFFPVVPFGLAAIPHLIVQLEQTHGNYPNR